MIKRTLLSLLCCTSLYSFGQNLYVNEKSGSSSTYGISNVMKITFDQSKMTVHTITPASHQFAFNDIRSVTFNQIVTKVEDDQGELQVLSAFPNPCGEVLNLSEVIAEAKYLIFDMDGSLIQSGQLASSINVSGLNSGVYFINIVTDEHSQTIKFIKQ